MPLRLVFYCFALGTSYHTYYIEEYNNIYETMYQMYDDNKCNIIAASTLYNALVCTRTGIADKIAVEARKCQRFPNERSEK